MKNQLIIKSLKNELVHYRMTWKIAIMLTALVILSCEKESFPEESQDVIQTKDFSPTRCDNSNRPIVNAQLLPIGTLSQARTDMAVASTGNKIVFAGGLQVLNNSWGPSSRVDIYDITANTWSTAELCSERYGGIGAASSGNKIFFGGGEYGDGTWPVDSVDIYDVANNKWTVSHLSCAGNSICRCNNGSVPVCNNASEA